MEKLFRIIVEIRRNEPNIENNSGIQHKKVFNLIEIHRQTA